MNAFIAVQPQVSDVLSQVTDMFGDNFPVVVGIVALVFGPVLIVLLVRFVVKAMSGPFWG